MAIRRRGESNPGGSVSWIRSIPRRPLVPGSSPAPASSPALGRSLATRLAKQPADDRLSPPSAGLQEAPVAVAGLQEARVAVAALLADVERLRPGLALHRCLDLEGGSGVRAQALCEHFGGCDALCASPNALRVARRTNRHSGRCRYLHGGDRRELSFPDETFDLVHCGTLPSDEQHGERLVAEALRVLRLRGTAVVDLARTGPAASSPGDPLGSVRILVHLPAFADVDAAPPSDQPTRLPAGRRGQIKVTITNAGARVLGSVLAPLRLQARRRQPGGASGVVGEALLDGILLPGESRLATLPLAASSASAPDVLELSLIGRSAWAERGSIPVALAVDRRVCVAVARAGGVMLGARILETRADLELSTRYFFARK